MFKTTTDADLAGNPIDEFIGNSIKYAAVTAAAKLGVFTALREGPKTLEELAGAIGASVDGTRAVADVAAVLGWLELSDGRYATGPLAERWLDTDSVLDFTPALLWAYELTNVLWELPQAVRDGKPAQSLWERWADKPEAGKDFSAYMKVKSRLTVDSITEAVPVPEGAQRLLDLGGSHGLHTMAFCRRYPELTATILDLPEALANTGAALEAEGLADRVSLRRGSFLTEDLGEGYDVVLLFEIVHNHTDEENRDLIARAAKALRPGGKIVVLEDVRGEKLDEHNAAFSLAMFACSGDRTYSLPEITGWMEDADLATVEHIALPSSVSLVVGTK
ncbi:SAM-dependent methyltransferase [Kitasatospora phosalacinea]|uniref:SAM-dependent methyltransferase n=1 Tax=Kitasatospora phosalacinea TaxID=2065 RepID=A0A9W6Q9U4_9ACTN|nr:methyltransferase [Kitasatospora phosalacinea]GLW71411.1 SAM-dependent methyltransferase [Kitasatospora phosalacinea]